MRALVEHELVTEKSVAHESVTTTPLVPTELDGARQLSQAAPIASIMVCGKGATVLSNQNMEPRHVVMNRELNFVIEHALQQVPFEYRMVFSMREINGLSVVETAEARHISEVNVKVRLNRAKAMLRTEVEKSYTAAEIFEFNRVYCDAMLQKVMAKISPATH